VIGQFLLVREINGEDLDGPVDVLEASHALRAQPEGKSPPASSATIRDNSTPPASACA